MKIAIETTFNEKDERVKKFTDFRKPYNMSEIDTLLAVMTVIQHDLINLRKSYEKVLKG